MKAFPELTAALREMLDRMDASLRAGGYEGPIINDQGRMTNVQ
jgi:hypothetical protein